MKTGKLRDTRTGLEHEVRYDPASDKAWIDAIAASRKQALESEEGEVVFGHSIEEGGNRLFHFRLEDLRGLPEE